MTYLLMKLMITGEDDLSNVDEATYDILAAEILLEHAKLFC